MPVFPLWRCISSMKQTSHNSYPRQKTCFAVEVDKNLITTLVYQAVTSPFLSWYTSTFLTTSESPSWASQNNTQPQNPHNPHTETPPKTASMQLHCQCTSDLEGTRAEASRAASSTPAFNIIPAATQKTGPEDTEPVHSWDGNYWHPVTTHRGALSPLLCFTRFSCLWMG